MSLFLQDTIQRLSTNTYSVVRPMPGGYDANGRPAAPTNVPFTILAVLYPATAQELLRLPEGERSAARITIYALTELALGDLVDADGSSWQVDATEVWVAGGFFKALARRVEP